MKIFRKLIDAIRNGLEEDNQETKQPVLRKGVVADILEDKGAVIVLTPDGDILEVKTPKKTYEIGEQILFYEIPKGK